MQLVKLLTEGKVFSKSVALGRLTTVQWKTTHPRTFGQQKLAIFNIF